ncbi:MAG: carboxypeptidase-like regulatory domain-containing protein [Actinomycetota bacterium]
MSPLRRRAPARPPLRAVRRLTAALLSLSLVAPTPVAAQTGERGSIKGVVTNGTTNEPQQGVEIRLVGGLEDAQGGFRQDVADTATSNDRGRFEFQDLPAGLDRAYTLDARFDGGNFPGGVVTIPSAGDVIDVTQRVWNTTTDARAIVIERNNMFLLQGDDGANVVESYTILNASDEAYIGRGGSPGASDSTGDDAPVPTLSFSLPDDAEGVQIADASLDIPELISSETGLGITSAVPPNETRITFAYSLRVNTGQVDLSRRALYPILNLGVFAEPPFVIDSPRLGEDGDVTIEGTTYKRYRSQNGVTEGNSIPMIAIAQGESETALIAGAIAAGLLLVVLLGFALLRRRAIMNAKKRAAEPAPEERHDLLVAIARLDLDYHNEKLDEEHWRTQRAALKAKLAEHKAPEPSVE